LGYRRPFVSGQKSMQVRFRAYFWAIWGHLGAILEFLGAILFGSKSMQVGSWGNLEPSWGQSWGHLGCNGRSLVKLMFSVFGARKTLKHIGKTDAFRFWRTLGHILGHLGPSWASLALSWVILASLGPSWCHLGAILASSWAILGLILGYSWRFSLLSWGRSGLAKHIKTGVKWKFLFLPFFFALWPSSCLFWRSLAAVLGILGAILGHLGPFLGPSWGHLGHSWAVLGPSGGHLLMFLTLAAL
jgi:hypothetical protein